MRFRKTCTVLLAVVGLFVPIVAGQSIVTGAVTGVVTDPTGAIVANVKVTLTSNETGEVIAQTTGSNGNFTFPLLKPGSYKISLSQQGFRTVSENVSVALGQTTSANVKLALGSSAETLEVSGEAPLLQTEDANISTTFNETQITALPTPGGDITTYAQTAPGVLMNTGGSYGNFTAFGLPATSNLFTLNGNDENDPFLNLNNSGSSNLLLGQNEVQEVAVVSNGYTAQYGRQAGVQVDYTTKSGSNDFHGDAAFFYNSSMFNANDWFQKNSEIFNGQPNIQPFAVNHMWAASIGGPIVKNKLFFYVDQEGLYYALPSVQSVNLPTPQFAADVQATVNGAFGATSNEATWYKQWLGLYAGSPVASLANAVPNPAAAGSCGDLGTLNGHNYTPGGMSCLMNATASGVNHNKEWLLTERIDYNVSNNDKIFGRFKADHGQQPTSTDLILPAVFSTFSNQPEYEGQINYTHVFTSNIVNNAILSGLWYTAYFVPDSGQANVLAQNGYSTIQFNDGTLSSLGGTGLGDFNFPQGRNSSMIQFTDDFSMTKGSHTFKMGVNARRDYLTDYDAQSNTGGQVQFGSLNDFANGVVNGANGDSLTQVYTTNGDVRLAFYSLGLYFQDEYRVNPNLKLTLALRGDRNSNPICSRNCFSRLFTPFSSLTHDVNTPYNAIIDAGTHSAFPNLEKVALQPRIGFTWSPLGHTSTVLRGGIGVFSDLYQGILMDQLIQNSPFTNTFNIKPTNAAPLAPSQAGSVAQLGANSNSSFLGAFSGGGTLNSILASNPFFAPPGFTSIANQIDNPKYLEWNFEIQQALGSKMTVNLNYVGTHGYDNLIQNANLNAANVSAIVTATAQDPAGTFTPFGQLPPGTATGTGVLLSGTDPRFGTVRELQSVGISNYEGLVATFTRKFSHGFQGSLNYTFAHALDDLTSTNPGTPFNASQSVVFQVNPNCLKCQNYASSDSDARQNITANYVWDLPFKTRSKGLNELVGGWEIAGTVYAHTGLPYTPQGIQEGVDFNSGLFGIPLINSQVVGPANVSCSAGNYSYQNAGSCVSASSFSPTGVLTQSGWGSPRNQFRGPGYFDTDLNVNKKFLVTERVKLELGASLFNILNHPNFGLPNPYTFNSQFGQLCPSGLAFGCTGLAVQPTTPYGAFQGAGVEGRLIQIHGKIVF